MPITGMRGSKGPDEAFPGKSGLNMIVLGDVEVIIVVQKIMISDLPKDGEDRYNQKQAGHKFQTMRLHIDITPQSCAKLIGFRNT